MESQEKGLAGTTKQVAKSLWTTELITQSCRQNLKQYNHVQCNTNTLHWLKKFFTIFLSKAHHAHVHVPGTWQYIHGT